MVFLPLHYILCMLIAVCGVILIIRVRKEKRNIISLSILGIKQFHRCETEAQKEVNQVA